MQSTSSKLASADHIAVRQAEFAAFYRADAARLVGFVMKIGATEHEAADAAQSAFTQAWASWESIHTNPRAWVRTVATREFYRLSPVQEFVSADVPDQPMILSPDVQVELSEGAKTVQKLLNDLPPMQRIVLAWTADGFSAAEIARATVCGTEAAVRKNLQRARATLKTVLADRDGGAS